MAKVAKRTAVVAPQNKEELNEFIRELGELQRQQDELNTTLARKLDEVTAETTKLLQPLVDQAQTVFDGIAAYTSAHRDELTEGDKIKTIKLPAGECNWRWSPWAVVLKKKVEEILTAMKALNLERFIRPKEELDKEKMLKEPEVVKKVAGLKSSVRRFSPSNPQQPTLRSLATASRRAGPSDPRRAKTTGKVTPIAIIQRQSLLAKSLASFVLNAVMCRSHPRRLFLLFFGFSPSLFFY